MIGALLFGLMVACFFGAGFAAVWRWSVAEIDRATTLPDPRARVLVDDTTTRIQPINLYDLPRRGRSTFEEIA